VSPFPKDHLCQFWFRTFAGENKKLEKVNDDAGHTTDRWMDGQHQVRLKACLAYYNQIKIMAALFI